MYTIWTSSISPLVVLDKMKLKEPNTLSPSSQFFFSPKCSYNMKSVMKLVAAKLLSHFSCVRLCATP